MVDATDQPLMIWKTLAISEHLSERFLAHPIWPIDPDLCAPAHSLGAEMQCSFVAPRNHCRMHIGINLSHRDCILWRNTPAVQANIGANSRSAPRFYLDPTGRIWPARLAKLMFFCAHYRVVKFYVLPASGLLQNYFDTQCAHPAGADRRIQAMQEVKVTNF